jgi:AraC family transcriptional regulator
MEDLLEIFERETVLAGIGATKVRSEVRTTALAVEWAVQEQAGFFRRVHCLDQPTLVYIPGNNGCATVQGWFQADEARLEFQPFGLVVFVPRRVPLHVISKGIAERAMLICRFDPHQFEAVTGVSTPSVTTLRTCRDLRSPAVLDVLERLVLEMREAEPARDTVVAGLGLVLLGEVGRHFARVGAQRGWVRGGLAPWQLHQIEERLSDDQRPLPEIAELALMCRVSPRHLERLFKATTGTTLGSRIEQVLFMRAVEWLQAMELPVKSIALRLGYRNMGSFSTAFRRRFGESPSSYQRRKGRKFNA